MEEHDDNEDIAKEVANQRIDYLVTTFKGAVGVLPFGGLVAEAVGAVIPRQRIDRMADVLQKMAVRLDELGIEVEDISGRFRTSEFTDVFEESLRQAGRALSEDRRQFIANLLFTSLTEADFENARTKKLLFLLDDLTDPELIWLTFAGLESQDAQNDFYSIHESVLDDSVGSTLGSSPADVDVAALRESYWQRLIALGLTQQRRGPGLGEITPLGRLMLRYIGAPTDSDEE
jgi:hypothetical protein